MDHFAFSSLLDIDLWAATLFSFSRPKEFVKHEAVYQYVVHESGLLLSCVCIWS